MSSVKSVARGVQNIYQKNNMGIAKNSSNPPIIKTNIESVTLPIKVAIIAVIFLGR